MKRLDQQEGYVAEHEFREYWKAKGKKAFLYRVTDTAEVTGYNNRRGRLRTKVLTKPQPSDFIVTYQGDTFYAEIKATKNEKKFSKGAIKKNQIAHAAMITAAGGKYQFFVKSLHKSVWFRIPASFVLNSGASSWTWEELAQFAWIPTNVH